MRMTSSLAVSRLCATASLVALTQAPAAHAADEQTSIEVASGISASTNPFLTSGPRTGAASAFVEIRPQFSQTDEIATLVLAGFVRAEQYTRRYNHDESAALSLDVTRQVSERVKLRGGASVRSNRSSAQDLLTEQAIDLIPVVGLQPIQNDVTFVGRRTRTFAVAANVGATFAASATESWDADAGTGIFKFKDTALSDYRYANQQLAYARLLSERTWLKASVGVGEIDYLGRKAGDALIVSPLAGIETKLRARLTASFQAGLSLTSIRQGTGGRSHGTGLALRVNVCGDQDRGRFCLTADRSSQPTALGTVSSVTSLAGSLSRRVSRNDTLQLNANFSRTSNSAALSGHPTFVGASGELDHMVRQRFSLFAGANYADIFDSGVARRSNFQGRIGLRYRFGAAAR
jgi:hypothetical protein